MQSSPVIIRLPLHLLQYSQVDIPVETLKKVLVQLLQQQQDIPTERIKLCWQPQHLDIQHLNIPWLSELNKLVIPSFIEQVSK